VENKSKTRLYNIAVAKDEAFQFVYQDTLDFLSHQGFNISYFSPLHDPHLPENMDGYYFPGGYPELYAETLSNNHSLLSELKKAGAKGKLIIGECGGLMYLGKGIIDSQGTKHSMVGLFNFQTSLKTKKLTLGYRKLVENSKVRLEKPITINGHEFHYSSLIKNKETPHWTQVTSTNQKLVMDGFQRKNCFAFYSHIYWGSNRAWVNFIIKSAKQ
jgi:cobyrinic acid a,c-diamide synthase